MSHNEIRVPKQKRSIEKKNAIIKASYELFCEKGYHKTNTAEIAKAAGVSTGIVYNYFQDKSDILLKVIKLYISRLKEQFYSIIDGPIDRESIASVIEQFIDSSIASHTMHVDAHNEFLALSLLERDIQILFGQFENTILERLREKLMAAGFSNNYLLEKIRISYGIVEQLCHDYIQHNITDEELEKMKSLATTTIVGLLNGVY